MCSLYQDLATALKFYVKVVTKEVAADYRKPFKETAPSSKLLLFKICLDVELFSDIILSMFRPIMVIFKFKISMLKHAN